MEPRTRSSARCRTRKSLVGGFRRPAGRPRRRGYRRKVHPRSPPPSCPHLRRRGRNRRGKPASGRFPDRGRRGGVIHAAGPPLSRARLGETYCRSFGFNRGRFRCRLRLLRPRRRPVRLRRRYHGFPHEMGNGLPRLHTRDAATVLYGRGDGVLQPAPLHPPRNAGPDIGVGSTKGILGARLLARPGSPPEPQDLEVRPGSVDTGFHPGRLTGRGGFFSRESGRRQEKNDQDPGGVRKERWNSGCSHCGYFFLAHRPTGVNESPPAPGGTAQTAIPSLRTPYPVVPCTWKGSFFIR